MAQGQRHSFGAPRGAPLGQDVDPARLGARRSDDQPVGNWRSVQTFRYQLQDGPLAFYKIETGRGAGWK